jgi:phosphoribosylanthranilate isomerase
MMVRAKICGLTRKEDLEAAVAARAHVRNVKNVII